MASVNKVIVLGRIGKDIELRKTAGGASVASFTVATSEKYTDKHGQKQEETEWHNVVLWNRLAEIAGQYCHKGSQVYIEGKLTTRSWEDNGQKKYKTEIVGSALQLLDSKPQNQQNGGSFGQQQYQHPQGFGQPQQQYQQAPQNYDPVPWNNQAPQQYQQAPQNPAQFGLPPEENFPF